MQKNLDDLSNAQGLDESITENYTNNVRDDYYGNINWKGDEYSNIDWKDPFKGLRKTVKAAGKSIKDAGRDAGKNIERTTKEIGKNIKTTTKEIGQNIERTTKEIIKNKNLKKALSAVFLKYNPAVAIPRSSALLAFRVNLFGISARLYPAFLDEESLKKGNFDLANAAKAKEAWEDVANFWEDKLGGDRNKLREAISGAWNKPIFKTKKSQARRRSTGYLGFYGTNEYITMAEENFSGCDGSFDGIDLDSINKETLFGDVSVFYEDEKYSNFDPYSGTAIGIYISLGLSVIGYIAGAIGKKGASKNPYNDGSPQAQGFNTQLQGAGTIPPASEAELDKIIAAAKADREKGLGLDSTGLDLRQLNDDEVVVNKDGTISRKSGKILGIPKTAFWIGVSVLGILAGIIIYKKFIKK
jgi:hypothetical protein